MKILVSAYACAPNRGSEPGNGWHWAIGNAMTGHEVWCITTNDGKKAIEQEMLSYPQLKLHFIYVEVPRLINYLYRFQPFVYVHYMVWQYRASQAAVAMDREVDFDLVHHVTLASLQLGSGMWRLSKPLIFGPVGGGNFAPRSFRKYFSQAWVMEVFRKVTSDMLLLANPDAVKTIRRAELILTANSETSEMARLAGGKRIELFLDTALPNDFFSNAGVERRQQPILKILWVGRLFARKGLPLVLEALSKVDKHIPFHLTILGDGKEGKKLPGWLVQYGINDRATWLGQVSWDVVKNAYREHDVFMFCSLRDSFGSQLLEAMAFGLPVIALNHQGAGDHVPETAGIKVDVVDPDTTVQALAEAVEYLYFHPEKCHELGMAGTEFARQHRWELTIERMQHHYEQVVSGSKVSAELIGE